MPLNYALYLLLASSVLITPTVLAEEKPAEKQSKIDPGVLVFLLTPNTSQYITVTSTAGPGGKVAPEGAIETTEGEIVEILITADTNYEIDGVSETCGGSLVASKFSTKPVEKDCTVDVSFKALPEPPSDDYADPGPDDCSLIIKQTNHSSPRYELECHDVKERLVHSEWVEPGSVFSEFGISQQVHAEQPTGPIQSYQGPLLAKIRRLNWGLAAGETVFNIHEVRFEYDYYWWFDQGQRLHVLFGLFGPASEEGSWFSGRGGQHEKAEFQPWSLDDTELKTSRDYTRTKRNCSISPHEKTVVVEHSYPPQVVSSTTTLLPENECPTKQEIEAVTKLTPDNSLIYACISAVYLKPWEVEQTLIGCFGPATYQ